MKSWATVTVAVALMLAVTVEGRPRTILDYNVGTHLRRESGIPGVAVEGEYRWRAADGQENVVRYTADKNGFVARGNVVPGYYEPLGTPLLEQEDDQTVPEATVNEDPVEAPIQAAEADSNDASVVAEEETSAPSDEGDENTPVQKAVEDAPSEQVIEDDPDQKIAQDTSLEEVNPNIPEQEVAQDSMAEDSTAEESSGNTPVQKDDQEVSMEDATEAPVQEASATADEPVQGVPEDADSTVEEAMENDIVGSAVEDALVDTTRDMKAVSAEDMENMNAIIFPEDPAPSVPMAVDAVNEMLEDEDDSIVFSGDAPVEEMTETEELMENVPVNEMEGLPDMIVTEAPSEEESEAEAAPVTGIPEKDIEEVVSENESMETETQEDVTTEEISVASPVTMTPEELQQVTEGTMEMPESDDKMSSEDDIVPDVAAEEQTDAEVSPITEMPEEAVREVATEAPSETMENENESKIPNETEEEESTATKAPEDEETSNEETLTEAPATEESSEEESVTTDEPEVEEVSTDEPDVEEASTDESDVEEASTDEPDVEEASTDEHDAEETSTDSPVDEDFEINDMMVEEGDDVLSTEAPDSFSSEDTTEAADLTPVLKAAEEEFSMEGPAMTEEAPLPVSSMPNDDIMSEGVMSEDSVTEVPHMADSEVPEEGSGMVDDFMYDDESGDSESDETVDIGEDAPAMADEEMVVDTPVEGMTDDAPDMPAMTNDAPSEMGDNPPAVPKQTSGEVGGDEGDHPTEPEILGYIHSHAHAHFFDDDHHDYPAHPRPRPYKPHFIIFPGNRDGNKPHHGHVFNFFH